MHPGAGWAPARSTESVEEQRKGRYGRMRGGVRGIVLAGLRNSVETVNTAVRTAFPTSPASGRRATFRSKLAVLAFGPSGECSQHGPQLVALLRQNVKVTLKA